MGPLLFVGRHQGLPWAALGIASDPAHLILSSSPTLANPFQNPFHFSRISLLYFDLNAQDLQLRPEGGNPPQISLPICLHSPQGPLLPPPLLLPSSLSQKVHYTFPDSHSPFTNDVFPASLVSPLLLPQLLLGKAGCPGKDS